MVSGAFAKAFRADVQPVEIASALQRELDDRAAIVGKGTTMVPNSFVVELSPHDYDRLEMYAQSLGEELTEVVRDHAKEQNYQLRGEVSVTFARAEDLDIGVHRLRSTVVSSVRAVVTSQPQPQPQPQPPAAAPAPVLTPTPAPIPAPTPALVLNPAPVPVPRVVDPGAAAHAETTVIKDRPAPAPYLEVHGDRHPLSRPVTVLGRGTQVDLRIDDAGVSRRHAEIRLGPPAVLVDLNSTNGTTVDGLPVGEIELEDGASIGIGETKLVFRRPAE
jgi:predicted component of type VI protein secretion system